MEQIWFSNTEITIVHDFKECQKGPWAARSNFSYRCIAGKGPVEDLACTLSQVITQVLAGVPRFSQ